MNSRSLLALLVLGCSSSSHPINRTSVNNGTGNNASDSGTYTGDNSSCAVWPEAKLFPTVGPFFYGLDKGPCSATITDRSGITPKAYTINYTYDADDRPILAQTALGTTLIHRIEYSYGQGLLNKATDFAEGLQSQVTYSYGENAASYMIIDAGNNTYQYDYALDANGYPQTISIGKFVEGKLTPIATGASKFVFRYDNCKIQERAAYTAGGEPVAASTAAFAYDDAGHLVDVNSTNTENSYDYSCWLPPDAGTDDAGH